MTTQADYIRSDELADAAVPIAWLPNLFCVSESTIRRWLRADKLTTFDYPVQNDAGAHVLAVRFGDIPTNSTRWQRKAT